MVLNKVKIKTSSVASSVGSTPTQATVTNPWTKNAAAPLAQRHTAQPNPGPAPVATPDSGSQMPLWRRNASQAPGRSLAPSMLKSVLNGNASRLDPGLAGAMGGLSLSSQKPQPPTKYYDPSLGPEGEPIPDAWSGSACPSVNTVGGYNVAFRDQSCIRHKRTVDDFQCGEIICLPFHVANLNPKNKLGLNFRLVKTCEGPAFSKRRMFVVLYKHQQDLHCLPMYSFEGHGLKAKHQSLWPEYVQIKMHNATKFPQIGPYQPVVARTYDANRPLMVESCLHLTGGIRVDSSEDITYVGRLTEESYQKLVLLVDRRLAIAKKVPWEQDRKTDGNGRFAFPR